MTSRRSYRLAFLALGISFLLSVAGCSGLADPTDSTTLTLTPVDVPTASPPPTVSPTPTPMPAPTYIHIDPGKGSADKASLANRDDYTGSP